MTIGASHFTIEYYSSPENPAIIHPNQLKKMYELMLFTRLFDTKTIALQRTGQLGTYASSLGQEAVSTGIGFALNPTDIFVPYYRDYATQLLRGVTMKEILWYWGGSERGNHFQSSAVKEDLPYCVPIGSQCLHAAGIATAFKIRKQPRAVLVTCGDGATSEGDFYEAINIAGVWQLPLVFVIVNNQWAISIPRDKQSYAKTLAQKAIAGGIPGEQVDGNDVRVVYERVSHALQKARENKGPRVIEALTYRLSDHTTADDASRYRPAEEFKKAHQNDPLLKLKNNLISQGIWSDEEEKNFIMISQEQIAEAVRDYLASPLEPFENIFDYHYDNTHHAR